MEAKPATTNNAEENLDRATLLNRTNELANEFLDGVANRPVARAVDFDALVSKMRGDGLSSEAGNPLRIVEELSTLADQAVVATAGPRYFGFVVGGALPVTLAARDFLGTACEAGLADADFASVIQVLRPAP